ncbi:hypothetical protein PLICRDRAFT_173092 [Plicaturopsis crispa FD-325 SS-3]|nr:hypothetical protein PLICRDRAFT_173092 [Plicaturopsis crispa FD-325 SS-3]
MHAVRRLRLRSATRVFSANNYTRSLSLSAVEGATEPPLLTDTLPAYFEASILARHGARPALVCRSERPRAHGGPVSRNLDVTEHLAWDFGEFDRHIGALARGLLSMGVQRGDRVGVIMGNNSAYACLQWACASIGAILVTINPAYRQHELVATLKLVGVSHLFIVPQIRSTSYIDVLQAAFPSLSSASPGSIQEEAVPELRNLIVVDNDATPAQWAERMDHVKSVIDWREVMVWREDGGTKTAHERLKSSLSKDDTINLQFTSGTTGSPKAVSLTHHNLLNNALAIGRCMRLSQEDILCNVPPLFHCFDESSFLIRNLAAWSHGACIVYPSPVFNPKAIVDAVVQERCTALHGVPTHFLGVLREVENRRSEGEAVDTRQLRTGIAAGSSVPIELMRQIIDKLNLRDLTNAYGMTETSPVSFQTTPDDSLIKRVETVGKVQPHVKAKIVDSEGNIVPIGKPGEICISGYLLQKGYWQDEEHTKESMRKEGDTVWMYTGDEGIMDEEGYLRIVGRIKDIIIRGGENLFPVQIEDALTSDAAVLEGAAVAVPDAHYGEVVGAWIVRNPSHSPPATKESVRKHVAASMNPQNAPAWVWFLGEDGVPEELPKTASGKVMKHVLRKWSRSLAEKGVGRVKS